MICKTNANHPLFYTFLIQIILEIKGITSPDSKLHEGLKFFYDFAVKQIHYFLDKYRWYYYQDKICRIYEYRFVIVGKDHEGFVPLKVTLELSTTITGSAAVYRRIHTVKAYIDGCFY